MATSDASVKQSSKGKGPQPVETELLNVVVEREGHNVSAKWGLHPSLKEELLPEEWKELTEIMGKVTTIVGNRFSQVLGQSGQEQGENA